MQSLTYQVTARFDNSYEIVGPDETTDRIEAFRLAAIHFNAGRDVRIHQLRGNGSTVVHEATH